MTIATAPRIEDPDGFYEAWADALAGLDEAAAADFNARLVLLLANQVGDAETLADCIAAAAAAAR